MFNQSSFLSREGWLRTLFTGALSFCLQAGAALGSPQSVPDKLVVLTFDDAVKSHRAFVAPLLKELGFNATFFVTHKWMDDRTNFMTWEEIGELHQMGFEIGNHSWTHSDFSQPKNAAAARGVNRWCPASMPIPCCRIARPAKPFACGAGYGFTRGKTLSRSLNGPW